MQASGSFYGGAVRASTGAPRAPPTPRERKLMEVLLRARDEHVTTVLKCVTGWPFEEQANLANWTKVLERMDGLLRRALQLSPRLVVVALTEGKPSGDAAPIKTEGDMETDDHVQPSEASSTGSSAVEMELTEQVFEILRFTAVLLENAANKAAYNSVEVCPSYRCGKWMTATH